MPSYAIVALALASTAFLVPLIVPMPRIRAVRAGSACLFLMVAAGVTFVVATAVLVLGVAHVLPGTIVMTPALAGLGVAVALCVVMCWVAAIPLHDLPAVTDTSGEEEDDGGGGGGGLRPQQEPPRDPSPPDGIPWDAFDRERQGWELAPRPERLPERAPERVLVEV